MEDAAKVEAEVTAVLEGVLTYDEVSAEAQKLVLMAWSRRVAARLARLDLESEFRARGRSWSELDADGEVVVRQ